MARWCVFVAALTSTGCDVLFGLQLVPVPDAPPPGGYCDNLQPHPKFCADFDEGLATSGWQAIDNAGMAGTITSDTLLASSPPGSVRIDMPANPPLCAYERLRTELTGNFIVATASYAVLLGDPAGSVPVTLISEVGMNVSGTEDYLIYINAGASGTKVIEQYMDGTGAVTQATHPLAFIPTRVWTTLAIEIDQSSARPRFTVKVNGAALVAMDIFTVPTTPPNGVRLAIGVGCMDPGSAALEVHYDNAVLDSN